MLDPNAKGLALAMLLGPTLAQHGRVSPAELRRAAALVESIEEWTVTGNLPDDAPLAVRGPVAMPPSLSTVLPAPTNSTPSAPTAPPPPHMGDASGEGVPSFPVARLDPVAQEVPPQL